MVDKTIDRLARAWAKFARTKGNHSGFSQKADRILGWCAALAALLVALGLEYGPRIGHYFAR